MGQPAEPTPPAPEPTPAPEPAPAPDYATKGELVEIRREIEASRTAQNSFAESMTTEIKGVRQAVEEQRANPTPVNAPQPAPPPQAVAQRDDNAPPPVPEKPSLRFREPYHDR